MRLTLLSDPSILVEPIVTLPTTSRGEFVGHWVTGPSTWTRMPHHWSLPWSMVRCSCWLLLHFIPTRFRVSPKESVCAMCLTSPMAPGSLASPDVIFEIAVVFRCSRQTVMAYIILRLLLAGRALTWNLMHIPMRFVLTAWRQHFHTFSHTGHVRS